MDTKRLHTEDSKGTTKKLTMGKIGESMGAHFYEKYVYTHKIPLYLY